MYRKSKYIFFSLLALLGLCLFQSCVDDKLEEPSSDADIVMSDPDGIVLTFAVSLNQLQTSRASAVGEETIIDEYDNKVDTATFKVLVFSEAGDFLFDAKNRIITETPDQNSQWYIRIPLNNSITDSNGKSILGAVRRALENDGFKIAVLANWPANKVSWGWNQSALNSQASDKKTINDLHYLEEDSVYGKSDEKKSNNVVTIPAKRDVYNFLNPDFKFGVSQDWVKYSEIGKEADSDPYIRENWNPGSEAASIGSFKNGVFPNRYTKLWQVWNFGGSYSDSLSYSLIAKDKDDKEYLKNNLGSVWNLRSGDAFETWLGMDSKTKELTTDFEVDGFFFNAYSEGKPQFGTTVIKENGIISTSFHNGKYHGIKLGKTNYTEQDKSNNNNNRLNINGDKDNKTAGYIRFLAPATGKLRILWGSSEESRNAKFHIQRSSTYMTNSSSYSSVEPKQYYKDISINADPEYIYIYNTDNNAVVIYSIEYICDKYLYDTDRQGVEQLIPMYGVQHFKSITNWGSVPVLNLSQDGDNINLIRSVAKVELYLPNSKDYFYVGMRSMNRTSRNEPMDVENPTNLAWQKFTNASYHDATHCEWFDICNYGKGYDTSKTGVNEQVQAYQNWLSWFYGSWKFKRNVADSWNYSTSADGFWKYDGVPSLSSLSDKEVTQYPHIFNPSINRSDFCEFIQKPDVNGYRRYILYVPDKNIDDPNDAGLLSSSPKVAHIEYRSEKNQDEYLDDNKCHRIYFTNYSTNDAIKQLNRDQFDDYEITGLDDLWPIMRNHIYRFYVGSNNETQEIYVKVDEWGYPSPPKREEW